MDYSVAIRRMKAKILIYCCKISLHACSSVDIIGQNPHHIDYQYDFVTSVAR